MSSSHASKDGRRWRYYVSRAALTGRSQDARSGVRITASEIENRVAHAVGVHLVTQASARADERIGIISAPFGVNMSLAGMTGLQPTIVPLGGAFPSALPTGAGRGVHTKSEPPRNLSSPLSRYLRLPLTLNIGGSPAAASQIATSAQVEGTAFAAIVAPIIAELRRPKETWRRRARRSRRSRID